MNNQGGRSTAGIRLSIRCVFLLGLAAWGGPEPASAQERRGVRLFDGETLAGWEGSPAFFRVERGAIVGGNSDRPTPQNEFLCTREEFDDFVLRLQFRLAENVNSGVQIRSQRIPGSHEVIGYQADLGDGWWGALYDESRRNRALAQPDFPEVLRILDRNGWNDYEIVAQGRRVRLSINGHPTIDYTEVDPTLEQTGRICLQIHSGPPGEVRFRDLELERLPAAATQ